ncbi:MAG: Stp1/IreP family PP2C-type Ser/Thr phosphatase [Bdellovibrionia bacterium]
MDLKVGVGTDIGRRRSQNQDSVAVVQELGLYIVADGMGGHKGGEIASAIAVDTITESIRKKGKKRKSDLHHALKEAIEEASQAIFSRALKEPTLTGMGTTTTALYFQKNTLCIGQVGDSRCYYKKGSGLWQITRDHSLVQERLRAGLITRDQLKTDQMKNVITRSVGYEQEVNVELFHMNISPGDCWMICSDGLSGLVDDEQINQILDQKLGSLSDPQQAVHALIEAANQNGGDDNISAIVIQVC